MNIDCGTCVMRATAACDDCVVTFIVGHAPGDAVVIDADEERAMRLLSSAGLVPELRHVPPGHRGRRPVARVVCAVRPGAGATDPERTPRRSR